MGARRSGRPTSSGGNVRDRLESARRRCFVGRTAELELFRSALEAVELPFVLLYLHGPGGVGKSALLQRFADSAERIGVKAVRLNGREVESTPEGFLAALRAALGTSGDPIDVLAASSRAVLLVDTYESLTALDRWLRDDFLPRLPAHVLIATAGRQPPPPALRTEPGWRDLVRVIALQNLPSAEALTFLREAGVSGELHEKVFDFTRGHPLALALVADVLAQRGSDPNNLPDPTPTPAVVQQLLARFIEGVPTPLHRHALQACAEGRVTSETLLRIALDREDVRHLFEWLRGLSFVECGPSGLFPHDLARDVLIADLKWRDPDVRRALHGRIRSHAAARLRAASGPRAQQEAALDYAYTWRADAAHRFHLDWHNMRQAFGEPATRGDRQAIVDMVERHEGQASAALARHWLERQLAAFTVYRSSGQVAGCVAWLSLSQAAPEDVEADPGTRSAWQYATSHAPGGEVTMLRFFLDRDAYQRVSQACNVCAVHMTLHQVRRPHLSWDFLAAADQDFWSSMFGLLGYQRTASADFAVGGRSFAVFARDWRAPSTGRWAELAGEQARSPVPPSPAPLSLGEPEFSQAVRQALRDLRRPELLAHNPLLRSRLVAERRGDRSAASALIELVEEAADVLRKYPRDEKLYRVLDRTYLRPAQSQELAAELLALPSSTYRRHLAQSVARIVAWLRDREAHGERI